MSRTRKKPVVLADPIWERQENETIRQFEVFRHYRDAGPERSLVKVPKYSSNKSAIAEWSVANFWVKRCEAYDAHLDRVRLKAAEDEVKKMAERHAKLASAFQEKIIRRLQNFKPEDLSNRDLIQWLDISVKVERLSRGLHSEKVRNEMIERDAADETEPILDLGALSYERLKQLEELVGKAGSTSDKG